MELKKKQIKFKKDGTEKTMEVLYTEIVVNGKKEEVGLELYNKNNFVRKLLLEQIK